MRVYLLAGVLAVSLAACGDSGVDGPQFWSKAEQIACPSDEGPDTACFAITASNLGPDAGDGECWIAAIKDHETELRRSDVAQFSDVAKGEHVTATVQIEVQGDDQTVQYPAHCDPGPHG